MSDAFRCLSNFYTGIALIPANEGQHYDVRSSACASPGSDDVIVGGIGVPVSPNYEHASIFYGGMVSCALPSGTLAVGLGTDTAIVGTDKNLNYGSTSVYWVGGTGSGVMPGSTLVADQISSVAIAEDYGRASIFSVGDAVASALITQVRHSYDFSLAGRLDSELSLKKPISLVLEEDDPDGFILSDSLFGVYGEGDSFNAALEDYKSALRDYFELVSQHSHESPDDFRQFQMVRSYIGRDSEASPVIQAGDKSKAALFFQYAA